MADSFDPRQHYFVQRVRRTSFLEDWRRRRRSLARARDVRLVDSMQRRAKVGFLAGGDSPVPMRAIDARLLAIAPGSTTSTHRHSYDAVCFVLEGTGTSEIGSGRYSWARYDTLHTPANVWHRHANTGERPARLLAITDAPLVDGFGLTSMEDIGDAPPPAERSLQVPPVTESTTYGQQLARAKASHDERMHARRHTRFADVTLSASPKGSKSALLVDGSLGYRTTGLSMAIFEIRPGGAQAKHRHPGEAILYAVDGEGYSVIDDERVEWSAGDAPIVNRYAWHQHFNASATRPATVIRMHMWESVIQMMEAAMDPVPLYEDEPGLEERMRAAVASMRR